MFAKYIPTGWGDEPVLLINGSASELAAFKDQLMQLTPASACVILKSPDSRIVMEIRTGAEDSFEGREGSMELVISRAQLAGILEQLQSLVDARQACHQYVDIDACPFQIIVARDEYNDWGS